MCAILAVVVKFIITFAGRANDPVSNHLMINTS